MDSVDNPAMAIKKAGYEMGAANEQVVNDADISLTRRILRNVQVILSCRASPYVGE